MAEWSSWNGVCDYSEICRGRHMSQYRTRGVKKNKEGDGNGCGEPREDRRCPEKSCAGHIPLFR